MIRQFTNTLRLQSRGFFYSANRLAETATPGFTDTSGGPNLTGETKVSHGEERQLNDKGKVDANEGTKGPNQNVDPKNPDFKHGHQKTSPGQGSTTILKDT
ncbi:hypothetical protein AKO1_002584 [Acrasis kona]|uniref:SS2 n=1 Tax=Acrasis kona TaxID=1008807 RepID=A0AAW2ZKG0_9EUKA